MLAVAPAYNESKEKKRVLKKTSRLSRSVKEDYIFVDMQGDAGSSELPKPSSSPSIEVAKNETIVDKLGGMSLPADARRSSSISAQSLFTVEDSTPGSSETGSQIAPTSSTEQLRRKASRINRQLGENIPPVQTKRRQSVDFTAVRGSNASSAESLKRTRSLWTSSQRRKEVADEAAGEFQDRYLRNFGTGTMSERQRALNVKRARKMTQLFGQEPPPELIQIQDEREEIENFRDSTATLSTFLSPTPPPLRDRANSTSSTGTAGHDEDDQVSSTPPPFSTVTEEPAEPSILPRAPTFQDRRRRAAKLSRFFGVGFQDIGLSPVLTTPRSPPQSPVTSVEVDVKVSGRRFFGVFSDRPKEGDDMQEAIQKLRGLKAG
ncbi:Sec7 domain protein [Mycena venus]|uniref:Sec7 domain protein n=1 Tax=Mycena venus TaxID=2733690 RepID=A0A8H6XEH6_9AGAR|nr:Sec7 domain protein [Mycena venus]